MKLNEAQTQAAEYDGNNHLLLLAGAGTGKTRTIIARVLHLIKTGTPPSRILVNTFTRRAAKEVKERLKLELGNIAEEVVTGTFHFFCLSVMKRMPKAFNIVDTTVIDRDDQVSLMKLARSQFAEKKKEFPSGGQLIDYYSYARNTCMAPREYLMHYAECDPEQIEKIVKVFAAYEERKRKNNYLDFDDILALFAQRIHEEPRIREQLSTVFDHILVDEMQDTNPVQFRILEGLMNPALLFCVGDDAQSIYKFRGADFKNVHSFSSRIPNSQILRLEENYRSTQEILDLSNWILEQSPLNYGKHLTSARGPGKVPQMLEFGSEFAEAKWIAEDLIRRHEAGTKWREMMILTRTAFGAQTLEAFLVESKIPYVFIGGTSLLKAAHVKDLLSLCRVAYNHFDELAWVRYLTLWPGIGSVTAEKVISQIIDRGTFEEAIEVLEERFGKEHGIVEGVKLVKGAENQPQLAVSRAVKFLTDILRRKHDRWERRKKHLDLLVKMAAEHRTLKDFIEVYTLDPLTETAVERMGEDDAVPLITIHSAKGTEAEICYVIQAQPGVYPHIRSVGDEDDEEEERRILYVAATRSKDELIFTRVGGGGTSYGYSQRTKLPTRPENSYFLELVPEDVLEEKIVGHSGRRQSSFSQLRDF